MKRPLITMLLALLVGLGSASAQPLATYLPADAVVTFSTAQQDTFGQDLLQELAALNWEEAGESLGQIASLLEATGEMAELSELLELLRNPDQGTAILLEFCPAYADIIDRTERLQEEGDVVASEMLVTLSVSPVAPLPALTGVWRFDEEHSELVQDTRDTLLTCALEEGEASVLFTQDGIDAYIIGDGGDLPFIVGSTDNLLFFGTNPDVIRGVIRRVNGSGETSLADTPFYQRTERILPETGLSFSIDTAAIAGVLQPFAQFVVDGPETQRLVDRGLGVLRTLGGFAVSASVTEEGLLFESVIAVDPEGGEPALATLLLCEQCRIARPHLAPYDSVAVSSSHLPLRSLVDYIQGWLDDLAAVVGEPLDLRTVLRDELGLDIDTALLNWIGTDLHVITLEPINPNLRTLVYQPAQAIVIPVTDPDVARQGLNELMQTLEPFVQEIGQALNPLSELQDAPFYGMESTLVQSEYTYRDVTITRNRIGFNTDIGTAFIGNYLVVGTPARALEPLIDTFHGERSILMNPAYQQVLDGTPRNVQSLAYRDDRAWLGGLADLLDVLSQPLAFAMAGALEGFTSYMSGTDPYALPDVDHGWDSNSYDFDSHGFDDPSTHFGTAELEGAEAATLEYPGSLSGTLDDTMYTTTVNVSAFYELTGLTPGEQVSVAITSQAFDTYLSLIDRETGAYLDYSDDAPDTSRSEVVFTVEDGVTYWIEVTSYYGNEVGDYEVTVAAAEESPQAQETLSLEDIQPTPVTIGSTHQDTLDDASFYEDSRASSFYELSDLTPGDQVRVTMTSQDFDTYLYLLDGAAGTELAYNDDAPDTSRSEIIFTVEEGVTYWVEATSFHGSELGNFELTVAEATPEMADMTPLSVPGSVSGSLSPDSATFQGKYADHYELTDLTPGEQISVVVTSRDFDTYLYLLDGTTGAELASNDDAPDTNRSEITFTVEEGRSYMVSVTSFYSVAVGPYELTVGPYQDPFADLTVPTFAELLNLTDLLPQVLKIIKDRASFTESYTALKDGVVYSRSLMRVRW